MKTFKDQKKIFVRALQNDYSEKNKSPQEKC